MIILDNVSEEEKKQFKIMKLYNDGYTYKEISQITKLGESLIKKKVNNCINKMTEKAQHLIRKKHKINSANRKDINKVLKYEAQKLMSDKDFIIKNRSIYDTDILGNISLKKTSEINCEITWDTPKRLKKEMRYSQ